MAEQEHGGAGLVRLSAGASAKPLSEPDVVVYGLLPSAKDGQAKRLYVTDADGRVYLFEDMGAAAKMHESSASLFVLPFEGSANIQTKGSPRSAPLASCDETQLAALCKAIPLALLRGALVCFLVRPSTPLFYFSQTGVPSYEQDRTLTKQEIWSELTFLRNVIGYRLLDKAGARMEATFYLDTDIRASVGEVAPFFKKYGAAKFRAMPRGSFSEGTAVLGTDSSDKVVALAAESERGMFLWLPVRDPVDEDDLKGAIRSLARCLSTYRSKTLTEEPDWVREQFLWTGEDTVRQQKAEALETLESVEPAMDGFTRLRRILWTRDKTLEDDLGWFLQEMGLSVEAHETYKEDFWLLVEGRRAAIGEVKAINGNVKPSDLAHVVSHRKAAGKPDDFPTLFVANTFANREEVEKHRIEPNVCRRAKEDNVLVMRTLDLARFHDGMMKGLEGFDLDALWTYLRSGGGWLQVEAARICLQAG